MDGVSHISLVFFVFFCEEMKFKNVITSSSGVTSFEEKCFLYIHTCFTRKMLFYIQVKGEKRNLIRHYIERSLSRHYSTSFEYFMQLFPIYLFFYFRERDDGGGTRVMDFDLVHEIRE